MTQALHEKRDDAVRQLRASQEQHRQLTVHIERLIGRIATLDELIQENPEAPTEGQGAVPDEQGA